MPNMGEQEQLAGTLSHLSKGDDGDLRTPETIKDDSQKSSITEKIKAVLTTIVELKPKKNGHGKTHKAKTAKTMNSEKEQTTDVMKETTEETVTIGIDIIKEGERMADIIRKFDLSQENLDSCANER